MVLVSPAYVSMEVHVMTMAIGRVTVKMENLVPSVKSTCPVCISSPNAFILRFFTAVKNDNFQMKNCIFSYVC